MKPILLALACTVAAGCAPPAGGDDAVLVEDGKADDYYSDVAAEFAVTGTVGVELDHATWADETLQKDAVQRRLTAVALYLTAFVSQKLYGVDLDGDGVIEPEERVLSDDENLGYGGFSAIVRNETIAAVALEGAPPAEGQTATMQARFRVVVAGPRDLPGRLPRPYALVLPAGASFDPGDVDGEEVRRFDPDQARAAGVALETVPLQLARLPEPSDAWPRYDAFVADGVYDLTLVYGYDPSPRRYDLVEARKGYDALLAMGFEAPGGVDRFEALTPGAGPFVRTLRAGGRDVRVEVRLLHADQWSGPEAGRTARREAQRAQVLDELMRRDVFFYNGHAGPYEGMTLDPDGVAYVSSNDLSALSLDPAHPQLFVAQGCQSDSQYADALYGSGTKDGRSLDVIDTVNYAYGEGTMGLVEGLVHADGDRHVPRSMYALVHALNADPINQAREVYYGVVGLSDNPTLHPYADASAIGRTCTAASDCGDPDGNWCVRQSSGGRACAAVSLGKSGCPAGTRFRKVASGKKIIGAVCAR